nr:MAG TPA: hypothetical protein [Caudoviricetes sp.]
MPQSHILSSFYPRDRVKLCCVAFFLSRHTQRQTKGKKRHTTQHVKQPLYQLVILEKHALNPYFCLAQTNIQTR